MRKTTLVYLLLLVAFAMGCTARSEPTGLNEVTSDVMVFRNEKFAQLFTEGGQNTTYFEVVNQGSRINDARNVYIELYDTFDLKIRDVTCYLGRKHIVNGNAVGCFIDKLPYADVFPLRFVLEAPDVDQDIGGPTRYSVRFDYSTDTEILIPVSRAGSSSEFDEEFEYNHQESPVQPIISISQSVVEPGVPFQLTLQFENVGHDGNVVDNIIRKESVALVMANNDGTIVPYFDEISQGKTCDFMLFEGALVPQNDLLFTRDKTPILKCWFRADEDVLNSPLQITESRLSLKDFTYEYRIAKNVKIKAIK